jgi:hypothetical protein
MRPAGVSEISHLAPLKNSCAIGRSFHHGFHARQTFLKLTANHFVYVHEQLDSLGHEIVLAGHAPYHRGLVASGWRVNSVVLVAANGLKNSRLILIRSLGQLSVIAIRPSPTSLLPDHV